MLNLSSCRHSELVRKQSVLWASWIDLYVWFDGDGLAARRLRPGILIRRHGCLLLVVEVILDAADCILVFSHGAIDHRAGEVQSSNNERRKSAPCKTAPTNMHPLKLEARMSHRDRSAPLKSQLSKSFQHIRHSAKSVLRKFTPTKDEWPKKVRGKLILLRSAAARPVRKNEKESGSSSSMLGIVERTNGSPSLFRGIFKPSASRNFQVSITERRSGFEAM